MELCDTYKLNQIKKPLGKKEAQKAQLVIVTCETSRKLNYTTELTELLKHLYSHFLLSDPSFTLTKLGITWQNLENDCHHIMDAIKAAHITLGGPPLTTSSRGHL